MGQQLIFEFPLSDNSADLSGGVLTVDLGNGISLKTGTPDWVKGVISAKLQLIMEIEGSPPDADSGKPPVQ